MLATLGFALGMRLGAARLATLDSPPGVTPVNTTCVFFSGANVCAGSTSTAARGKSKPESTHGANSPSVLITIDKTTQKMTVSINGTKKYNWRVSTGRPGYSTPSGTCTATSMNEVWYSKEWDSAPMPHSIFFMADGHAIHGSYEVKTLGKPVSHGCVRISPQNATTLYALVGTRMPALPQSARVSGWLEVSPANGLSGRRIRLHGRGRGVRDGFWDRSIGAGRPTS